MVLIHILQTWSSEIKTETAGIFLIDSSTRIYCRSVTVCVLPVNYRSSVTPFLSSIDG